MSQQSESVNSRYSPERIRTASSILEPDSPPELEGKFDEGTEGAKPPSLEYRSYTPNYEEELRKIRKSSRGMSYDGGELKPSKSVDKSINDREGDESKKSEVDATVVDSTAPLTEKERNATEESVEKGTVPIEKTESPGSPYKKRTKENEITKSIEDTRNGVVFQKDTSNAVKRDIGESKTDSNEVKNPVLSIFRSLNLDSKQQDGSASEDVDANMEEFLRVPSRLEGLMLFGVSICADSFLHVLAVTPLKFVWSLLCLVCTIIRPRKGIGFCRFHRR